MGVDAEFFDSDAVDFGELFGNPFAALIAHEASNGQGHFAQNLTFVDESHASAHTHEGFDGKSHVVIVAPGHNDVVRIVGDGEGDGAFFEAVTFEQADGDIAGQFMAFNYGHFDDVGRGIGDKVACDVALNLRDGVFAEHTARLNFDHMDAIAFQGQTEAGFGEVFEVNGGLDGMVVGAFDGQEIAAVASGFAAIEEDLYGFEIPEVLHQGDVSPASGNESSAVLESKGLSGVQGGHADGRERIQPCAHAAAQMVVQVAFAENGVSLPVVGAEEATAAVFGSDSGQQTVEVVAGAAAAQEDKHAAGDALLHLGHGAALVVGENPGGGVSVQRFAAEAGAVAVDQFAAIFRGEQFIQTIFAGIDDAGKIHEFSEATKLRIFENFYHILSGDRGSGVFKGRGGNAGGQQVFDVQGCFGSGPAHVVEALTPRDVDNFVGVGDEGAGAQRHEQAAQFFGRAHGGFNVNMRVDQGGQGIETLGIDFDFAFVKTRGIGSGNLLAGDGNLALADFSAANVDNAAVFN